MRRNLRVDYPDAIYYYARSRLHVSREHIVAAGLKQIVKRIGPPHCHSRELAAPYCTASFRLSRQ